LPILCNEACYQTIRLNVDGYLYTSYLYHKSLSGSLYDPSRSRWKSY